jgi:Family of unknown function (DUF5330)
MGLIRKIIVLGGIIAAMPSQPHSAQDVNVAQLDVASWSYISAAAETVSDFKSFCDRKPQVCVTAQFLAGSLEGKAKYSAKLVYEWANVATVAPQRKVKAPAASAKVDEIRTSTFDTNEVATAVNSSTLKIEDVIPEWHGSLAAEKG